MAEHSTPSQQARSDELEFLKSALERVQEGIIVLDADLNAVFMNQAVRCLWRVSDAQADGHPAYARLVSDARKTGTYGVAPDELERFIASRIALVRAGDPTPQDLHTCDGRYIRSRCTVLPNGGRMLTYTDVTDLVRNAQQLETLATVDAMTGLYNRRHFFALADPEWSRFQRHHRPLSILMVDVDHFKAINDRFGHAKGDEALRHVANACCADQRSSDVVGRIGGEEFAVLLPETNIEQATIVAERIRGKIANRAAVEPLPATTVSVGVAGATLSMSGIDALLRGADHAMYRAKAGGRNRVAQCTPTQEMPELAAE